MLPLLSEAAERCVRKEHLNPDSCEVSLTLVTGEEIREWNARFRGVDSVTDVLSFPQYENLDAIRQAETWQMQADRDDAGVPGQEIMLGDIVICEDKVREQAAEFGHSFARELVYLFVHSMHHLLGYDHMNEEEKTIMRKEEEAVMQSLNLMR